MARSRSARRNEIPVSEFKAQCLRLIADVGATGREIIITRHGKAIVRVVPLARPAHSTRGLWKGVLKVKGDIVHADWTAEFDAAREG